MVSLLRRWASTMIARGPASCASGARRGAAGALGQEGHREQADGAERRRHAEPGMDQEADGEEDRDPGQIDDRDRAGAGQKGADLIEVADRLGPFAGVPAGHGRGGSPRRARPGRGAGRAAQRSAPRRASGSGRGRPGTRRRRPGRSRARPASARSGCQHPVVDLQHVERAGEHQQVDDAREQRHAAERAPAIAQGRRDVGVDRVS